MSCRFSLPTYIYIYIGTIPQIALLFSIAQWGLPTCEKFHRFSVGVFKWFSNSHAALRFDKNYRTGDYNFADLGNSMAMKY